MVPPNPQLTCYPDNYVTVITTVLATVVPRNPQLTFYPDDNYVTVTTTFFDCNGTSKSTTSLLPR